MIPRRLAAVLFVGLSLLLVSAGGAQASGPTLTGAGSTWAAIALDQWRVDAARQGLNINYQAVGSTAGRQFYIIGQVDFAASEIPFLPAEVQQLKSAHRSFQYLPDVAGGTALMYNVKDASGHEINNLRLSANTIAKIFTGKITNWQNPAIEADNPGVRFPNQHLTPVIRSDGSGTTAKLADWLAHMDPADWNPFARQYSVTLPVQFWPNFPGAVAVRGSDGVANYVSNTSVGPGSIGYVEAGYVYEHSMVPAYIKNRSGNYAAPSSSNVAIALRHATLNPDLTQNLLGVYNAPEATAYPLASYSYLITQTTGFDPAKGAVLGKWIIYIACAGQKEAAPLGYSPLPPNLVKADFQALARIPGAPKPPPLTPQGCPNPTITGAGYGGGHQTGGQGVSGGGTGNQVKPAANNGGGGGSTTPATTTHSGGKTTGRTKTNAKSSGKTTVSSPLLPNAGVTITPLSAVEQAAVLKQGVKEASAAVQASDSPLVLAEVVLVLLVAGPLVSLIARRRRS